MRTRAVPAPSRAGRVAALLARGWVMHNGYAADGPDGTALGLMSRGYMVVIEGRWDGGDDADSTYVPAPGCVVTATCVPLRRDDVWGQ